MRLDPPDDRRPGPPEPASPPGPRMVRVDAASRATSLSRSTLYALMEQGELPYVKIGRTRRILWDDLVALIDRNRVAGDR